MPSLASLVCSRTGLFMSFLMFHLCLEVLHSGGIISNSSDFAAYLLDAADVAVIPGVDFGNDNHIRLSYATSLKNIEEGLKRISSAVKRLS